MAILTIYFLKKPQQHMPQEIISERIFRINNDMMPFSASRKRN